MPTDDKTLVAQNNNSKVQATTLNATNAFRWVQTVITPDMFVTPDSVIIGWSDPIKGSGAAGASIPTIGMCDNLTINTGVSVITLKELRNERTIIVPGKSAPGSINITRLLGNGPNFARMVSKGSSSWRMDTHSVDYKQLFGLVIAFMDPMRKGTICTLYAERCAIQSANLTLQAGQLSVFESVAIVFDRLIDDTPTATTITSGGSSMPSFDSTLPTTIPTNGLASATTPSDSGVGTTTAVNPDTGESISANDKAGTGTVSTLDTYVKAEYDKVISVINEYKSLATNPLAKLTSTNVNSANMALDYMSQCLEYSKATGGKSTSAYDSYYAIWTAKLIAAQARIEAG